MADLEFGQEWLAQPYPLLTFQLAQGTINTAVEARVVTE